MSAAAGYAGPANITYTLTDSSATRLACSWRPSPSPAQGTVTLTKRWTVYPTGRIFGSYRALVDRISTMDEPRVWTSGPLQRQLRDALGERLCRSQCPLGHDGRRLWIPFLRRRAAQHQERRGHDLDAGHHDQLRRTAVAKHRPPISTAVDRFYLATALFEATDDPITVNFALDISRDFTDSATADSLMKDLQTPATITA